MTAMREWKEESLSVFESCVSIPSFVVSSPSIAIFFVHVEGDMEDIKLQFETKILEEQYPEVVSLEWIEYSDFVNIMLHEGSKVISALKRVLMPSSH